MGGVGSGLCSLSIFIGLSLHSPFTPCGSHSVSLPCLEHRSQAGLCLEGPGHMAVSLPVRARNIRWILSFSVCQTSFSRSSSLFPGGWGSESCTDRPLCSTLHICSPGTSLLRWGQDSREKRRVRPGEKKTQFSILN